MTVGAVAAGAAAVSYFGGRLLTERSSVAAAVRSLHLPAPARPAPPVPAGSDLRIPGLGPFITPNSAFYRVDTAIVLPQIPPSSWQLRIHGMVSRELTLTFDQLLRRPLIEDYITLCCVSNPVGGPYIGNARWLGASLGALLREAGIRAGADQLYCTSSDGFTSGTPVQTAMDGRDALLAIGMNGKPLPTAHGFPVRTVVPGLYGYVSACKWITDIEVTTYAANSAYWSDRGWSRQAPIKTESRIDVPSGQGPVKGRSDQDRRRRLGAAQGHRRGRGAGGRRPLAPGHARCRAGDRHLAAVVGRLDGDPGHAPDRGAGDRQDRLHPDRAGRAARAERRERLPGRERDGHLAAGATFWP